VEQADESSSFLIFLEAEDMREQETVELESASFTIIGF